MLERKTLIVKHYENWRLPTHHIKI